MRYSLDGRVALVTGGTRGLGLAIAEALGEAGATVVVTSEDEAQLAPSIATLSAKGIKVSGFRCDVRDDDAQKSLIEALERDYGGLDILICNAGISSTLGSFIDVGMSDYESVMAINLRSILVLTQAAYPLLKRSGRGSVVLISSIAGVRGNALINAYAFAKAGLAQLARNLAVQWGPDGIRTNAIAPGFMVTELARPLLENAAFMQRRMAMTPLRRPGQPEEIGATALFLASDMASFITGQQLVVDGGTTITDGN